MTRTINWTFLRLDDLCQISNSIIISPAFLWDVSQDIYTSRNSKVSLKCYSLYNYYCFALHCNVFLACPTDNESRHHQPVRAGSSRMPGASVLLENLARQLRQRRAPELVPRQGHHHRPSAGLQVGPGSVGDVGSHTPSITFRHLPPHSAKIGYSTEGALFVSA